jgi:hypothetical protein
MKPVAVSLRADRSNKSLPQNFGCNLCTNHPA